MKTMSALSLAGALALVASCGGTEDPAMMMEPPPANSNAIADFSLTDVNATSPTFEQAVSPRDHLQKVSGWYFGHAT